MATAELGDWHTGRIELTKDSAQLIIFEQVTDEGGGQMCIVGLTAILALRDLIDEEVSRAEHRGELEHESNVDGVLTSGEPSGTI